MSNENEMPRDVFRNLHFGKKSPSTVTEGTRPAMSDASKKQTDAVIGAIQKAQDLFNALADDAGGDPGNSSTVQGSIRKQAKAFDAQSSKIVKFVQNIKSLKSSF